MRTVLHVIGRSSPISRGGLVPACGAVLLVGAVASAAACSSTGGETTSLTSSDAGIDTGTSPAADDASDGSSSFDGSDVVLAVDWASSPPTVGGVAPSGTATFLVLDVTMKNVAAPRPLSTSPALFSVATKQALVLAPSPAQTTAACTAATSVAAGGEMKCQIAFQLPPGQTPAKLLYDDGRGDVAQASVPPFSAPSTACETTAGWQSTQACGGCELVAQNQSCRSEVQAYEAACQECASCSTSADRCACEAACDDAACRASFDAVMACFVSTCAAPCSSATGADGGADGGYDAGACPPPPTLHPSHGSFACPFGPDGGLLECTSESQECCVGGRGGAGYLDSECTALGTACSNGTGALALECEDTTDCAQGVCCMIAIAPPSIDPTCGYYVGYVKGTRCESTCSAGELQICEANGECSGGGACTPFRSLALQMGFCM